MRIDKAGRLIGATLSERLMYCHVVTQNGCWEWTKKRDRCGYGKICISGRTLLAHRISYETFVGKIPVGFSVCHSCDNRLCINPAHLWLGSQKDNLADMYSKGRENLSGLKWGQRPGPVDYIDAARSADAGRRE